MSESQDQYKESSEKQFDLHTDPQYILSEGGPLNQVLVHFRLKHRPLMLVAYVILFTWLPLALLSLAEGTFMASGNSSFIEDVGTHIRFLAALPMLVLIRPVIDKWIRIVVNYFINTLLSGNEREDFLSTSWTTLNKWKGSRIGETVILVVVVIFAMSPAKGGLVSGHALGDCYWKYSPGTEYHTLSLAGKWVAFISIPVFQFALLRWLWKYILWMSFLFILSRRKLNITNTHPDLTGGLGVIFFAQKNFNLLFAAIGVSVSGELCSQLLADPQAFDSIQYEALAYIGFAIALVLLPLFFFYKQLLYVKYYGYLTMSKAGHKLGDAFEKNWLADVNKEKFEEGPHNPSTTYDYGSLYLGLKDLRVIPVTVRDVVFLAITLCVPFVPLLLIHFPVTQLVKSITGLLL